MNESRRKPNTACTICRKMIYRRPGVLKLSNGKAYCNQDCYGKSCRKEVPCLICKKPILSGANKKTCSRACANKNRAGIKYKQKRSLKDKVKTSRLLKRRLMQERGRKCERCGYDIYQILQVHHKIERHKGGTDEMINLELLCPNCHASEHYLKK